VHRFEEGKYSLEDEPKSGRSRSTEHVDAICALLANDLYLSQNQIACILNIHQCTVKYILRKDLSLRKVDFKCIPHRLNDD
jgi:hypothetical protein